MTTLTSAELQLNVHRTKRGSFENLYEDVQRRTKALAREHAQFLAREARFRAPVRSGHLRASIVAYRVGDGHWAVRVGAYYGIYVEYGTRYMHAQPYFTPAVELARRRFQAEFRKVLAQ